MNKKGDWTQVFLIMLFFLIVVVALALLFVERGAVDPERPEITRDFVDRHVDYVMISTLRLPVQGIDINGDGRPDEVTIADVLVINNESHRPIIERALQDAMPEGASYRLQGNDFVIIRQTGADLSTMGISSKTVLPSETSVEFTYADNKTRAYRLS